MSEQASLFAWRPSPPQPSPPAQAHSLTSREAAQAIAPRAGTLRATVLDWLRAHGPATDEAMQLGIPMPASTQRPRRVELLRLGLIREHGTTLTTSGRRATTWSAHDTP